MVESPPNICSTVNAIADGRLTCRQWVEHCLERVAQNNELSAWSYLDKERALDRADALDWQRKDGSAIGY